jgi:hypothetical protein
MRASFALPLLFLLAMPGLAWSDPPRSRPPETAAAADRNEAQWADWDAQARVTDGDYDGAVQAERQAEADRRDADHQEVLARSSER